MAIQRALLVLVSTLGLCVGAVATSPVRAGADEPPAEPVTGSEPAAGTEPGPLDAAIARPAPAGPGAREALERALEHAERGHVRGVERALEALAREAPANAALLAELRPLVEGFDLQRLAERLRAVIHEEAGEEVER